MPGNEAITGFLSENPFGHVFLPVLVEHTKNLDACDEHYAVVISRKMNICCDGPPAQGISHPVLWEYRELS